MIKITNIKGLNQILKNIRRVQTMVLNSSRESLKYGAELLRDKAIENLKNTSKLAGLSADGQSITKIENWSITNKGALGITLACNSKHAAIVELGGHGKTIVARSYGYRGWPVYLEGGSWRGWQQGYPPTPGKMLAKVKLQGPKNYFRSAINSEWVRQSMLNRIKRDIMKGIRGSL
jgi:hypothetical protein